MIKDTTLPRSQEALITTTPLNDLPAQDLRYRLVAHLGVSVDLPRPPVDSPTAKTTTQLGPHRKAPGNDADTSSLTKCVCVTVSNSAIVTATKMINTTRKGSPQKQPLLIVLAAALRARQKSEPGGAWQP